LDLGLVNYPGGVNDGEELWQGLVSRHPNFRLVLNGHVLGDGEGFLTSRGIYGNEVHQILANYQSLEGSGLGYLRLHEFRTDGTMNVSTYSPSLDTYHPGEKHHFTTVIGPPRMPGDLNGDGSVDASDYVVWRSAGGSDNYYGLWTANFGDATSLSATGVPELPSIGLLHILLLAGQFTRPTSRRASVTATKRVRPTLAL
jgi:hypothetical protein